MTPSDDLLIGNSYSNPVFVESFPDPFVLKYCGEYFAYCTGIWSDGLAFGIIHSRDLVNWNELGGAMRPISDGPPLYWAPEVTCHNGKFYMYYSTGNEVEMQIRVAVSDRPDGGFIDSGKRLTTEDFAIDPHVFIDDDGERYLFYATDFLDHTHIGTGTVVDRMKDWFTLAGDPRPVTRAQYDWQVYDPNRQEKGGVRWHTVEGPFVLKRKGIYHEMFSGGNWQNPSYGVSFANTENIMQEEEWDQFSDGEAVLPILRTIPDKVIGPGHNSVIRGPNNREMFCVYHSWTDKGRTPAIDRMEIVGKRIFINGPTYMPQPLPFSPAITFEPVELWRASENWEISNTTAKNTGFAPSELTVETGEDGFLIEFSFRLLKTAGPDARFVIEMGSKTDKEIEYVFSLRKATQTGISEPSGEILTKSNVLPRELDLDVFHHVRLEYNVCVERLSFEGKLLWSDKIINKITKLSLKTANIEMDIAGFALTKGFEDLFDGTFSDVEDTGWQVENGRTVINDDFGELVISASDAQEAVAVKGSPKQFFEFTANLRSFIQLRPNSSFGFVILDADRHLIEKLFIEQKKSGHILHGKISSYEMELPKAYHPENMTQFRFLRTGDSLKIESENLDLGEIHLGQGKILIGIVCENCSVALEMVRSTVL